MDVKAGTEGWARYQIEIKATAEPIGSYDDDPDDDNGADVARCHFN
jgi:hypothetical protein